MIRSRQITVLLPLTAFCLVAANHGVAAQTLQPPDNDTLAASMKAAIYVNGKARVPVEAGYFSLHIELAAQGKGRDAAQAEYQRFVEAVTRILTQGGIPALPPGKSRIESREDGTGETRKEQPDDVFGAYGTIAAQPRSLEEVYATLTALRAAGVKGDAVVTFSAKNPDAARLAALKAAIAQARQQAQALGDTVKPKEFDLLYIKQGTYISAFRGGRISLTSTDPIPRFAPVEAEMTATLFYGFKQSGAKTPLKANPTLATATE